jgi:hypothetical protein
MLKDANHAAIIAHTHNLWVKRSQQGEIKQEGTGKAGS